MRRRPGFGFTVVLAHFAVALAPPPSEASLCAYPGRRIPAVDVLNAEIRGDLPIPPGAAAATLSDDGSLLFVAHDHGQLSTIETATNRLVNLVDTGLERIGDLRYRPEHPALIIRDGWYDRANRVSRSALSIVSIPSGAVEHSIIVDGARAIELSTDGKTIAASGTDETLLLRATDLSTIDRFEQPWLFKKFPHPQSGGFIGIDHDSRIFMLSLAERRWVEVASLNARYFNAEMSADGRFVYVTAEPLTTKRFSHEPPRPKAFLVDTTTWDATELPHIPRAEPIGFTPDGHCAWTMHVWDRSEALKREPLRLRCIGGEDTTTAPSADTLVPAYRQNLVWTNGECGVPAATPFPSWTPTPTFTPTLTPTWPAAPRGCSMAGPCLQLGRAKGIAGESVVFGVSLDTGGTDVAGTENAIVVPPSLVRGGEINHAGGRDPGLECWFNDEETGKGNGAFAYLNERRGSCTGQGSVCNFIKALVLSFNNVDPIVDGSELYSCLLHISEDASPGEYVLRCEDPGAAAPQGAPLETSCADGAVLIMPAEREIPPTPTPLPAQDAPNRPVTPVTGRSQQTATQSASDGCTVSPSRDSASYWLWLGAVILWRARRRRT